MHIAPITSVAQPRKIGTVLTTLPYKRCVMLLAIAGGHSSISSCTLTSAKNALFEPFIYKKRSFCQDRLGTNIGKVEKKAFFAPKFDHTS
eukprot:COSAG06_NODE_1345_length_9785_cov_2.721557_1_plen_89_part_10